MKTLVLILPCLLGPMMIVNSPIAEPAPPAAMTCRRLHDLPSALSGRFAGVSHGALIVAGGSSFDKPPYDGGTKSFSDAIDVLETPGGDWKNGFHLPGALAQGASVTLDDGVLCIGGGDASRAYASVFRLRWTGSKIETDRLPDLPSPCAFSGAARIGNVVYVAGGLASPTATEALHMFWRIDLGSAKPAWESLPAWPGPGLIGAAVVAQGESIYVISGAALHIGADGKPARTYATDGYRYRPGTGWTRIAGTPGPVVAAPVAARADGKIDVFGGDTGADAARAAELKDRHPGFRRDILTYDTRQDRWTSTPDVLPVGLVTSSAVPWNDSIVIAGGEDRPGHRSTAVLAFPATTGASGSTAQAPSEMTLFAAGDSGYHTLRIPSLLATKQGSLLAFAEGRRNSASDAGAVELVMRRSTDGGKTWSPIKTVWADGGNTCGNPCPVQDATTGTICLVTTHNLGQDHEKDIIAGTSQGTRTVWVLRSEDDGLTWSAPQEITSTTKKADWGWYATGPGIGIQIQNGSHKGRLVIPCDHSENETKQWRSHAIFSDDGGMTWKRGGDCPRDHTNECQLAEAANGRLLLNMRSANTAHKNRSTCVSDDGGETWTNFHYDDTLTEPICQASFLGDPAGSDTLLFANPASTTERKNLTIRVSHDGGRTWPVSRTLYAGPAAYSSLALLPGGGIACLYERGDAKPYENITFSTFTREWLGDGQTAAR